MRRVAFLHAGLAEPHVHVDSAALDAQREVEADEDAARLGRGLGKHGGSLGHLLEVRREPPEEELGRHEPKVRRHALGAADGLRDIGRARRVEKPRQELEFVVPKDRSDDVCRREVGSEGVEQLVGGDDQRDERLFVEHAHEADGRKAPVLQIENRHGMRDARPRRVFGDRRPGDPLWRLAVRVPDECQRADRESPGRGRTALVEVGDVVHVDRLHEKVFDDIIVVAHEHRDGPLVGREAAVRCGPLRCVLNPREHTVPLPPRVEAVAHVAEERRIRDDRARAREHGRPRLRQSPHGPNVPDPHRCALDVNRVSLAPPGRLPRRACLETAFEEVVVVTVEAPLDLRIDARDLDDLEPLDVRQRLLDTRHGDRESVTVSRGRHERHAVGIFGAPLRRCRLRRPPASRLVVGALERIPLGVHSG